VFRQKAVLWAEELHAVRECLKGEEKYKEENWKHMQNEIQGKHHHTL
jgi:hypothetical protein